MNVLNQFLGAADSITKYNYTPPFSQNLFSRMSPNQQKVAVIAGIALGIIALLFLSYRCYLAFNKPSVQNVVQPSIASQMDSSLDHSPLTSPRDPSAMDSESDNGQSYDYSQDHISHPTDTYYQNAQSNTYAGQKGQFDPSDYVDDDVFDDDAFKIGLKQYQPPSHPKDPFGGSYQSGALPTPNNPSPYQSYNSIPVSPSIHQNAIPSPNTLNNSDPGEVDPVLSQLIKNEKEIKNLRKSIPQEQEELDTLKAVLESMDPNETEDMLLEQEAKIKSSEDKIQSYKDLLSAALKRYPGSLENYLFNRFTNFANGTTKDQQEIYEHLATFTGYMETFHDDHEFIREGLNQIDRFLTKTFFTSPLESCLQEEKKADLIVFQVFFTVVDQHYPFIFKEDPKLARRLRIKLANLPLVDGHMDRKKFNNIYLSESDQRKMLIEHFQQEEDKAVDFAIQYFKTNKLTNEDVKRLVKFVMVDKKRLSAANSLKLLNALKAHLGNQAATINWNYQLSVYDALVRFFMVSQQQVDPWSYQSDDHFNPASQGIKALYKASKVKRYFEKHSSVPRWYHTTTLDFVEKIIGSGELLALQRQAFFGAWVSTEREPTINLEGGDAVVIFNHDIADLDPNVFIGFEKGYEKRRWRGLQKSVPICKPDVQADPYLALVGLGKNATKDDKKRVFALLKSKGIKEPVHLRSDVIDYMQKHILMVVGNPNLTEKWWGKATVADLDKPLKA